MLKTSKTSRDFQERALDDNGKHAIKTTSDQTIILIRVSVLRLVILMSLVC